MSNKQNRVQVSRRRVLKCGMAVVGGVGFSNSVVGTSHAQERRVIETESIIPTHQFVRAEGADEPSPVPADDDLLVEREEGNPVDDGTNPEEVDGEIGQLTWEQFSAVEGRIEVECLERGTCVSMHLQNLVPNGLYTAWNGVFVEPGHLSETRDIAIGTQHATGLGPLGASDGSENTFRASSTGEAYISATTPGGGLGTFGEISDCALDEFEWIVAGFLHLDGRTYGSDPGPESHTVPQFRFEFQEGHPQS